jgi:thiosulfate/3-mercaptopyruvate sulfurtransferase
MPHLLLSVEQLYKLLGERGYVLVDCRFDLSNPQQGLREYREGHIPGAVYAHLDDHLSSGITPQSGRHPLPEPRVFAGFLASIGWHPGQLLIAYDAGNGAYAARLWWLMRYFGLESAVLDGGLAAWKSAGLELQQGDVHNTPASAPNLVADESITVSADDIIAAGVRLTLLDARAAERYSGAVEPLDSKAGHIPGALNRPFAGNLNTNGRFKTAAELKAEFSRMLEGREVADVVHYCGSGVTACHNLFAMELAGLPGSRIYPGSWSEWIRDPGRPVETSA